MVAVNASRTATVLDIEGTIGSIAFVHEVLFPYATARLEDFLRSGHPDLPALLEATRAEADAPRADLPRLTHILHDWIRTDRKATPLKAIQGLIWARGFAEGALRSHLYPDAATAIARWHAQGRTVAIFSSGSVHAQQLYLRHSDRGDLSGAITAWFDTTTGAKQATGSYRAIAAALGRQPAEIRFFSDTESELDAAAAAGWSTVGVDRDRPHPPASVHRRISTFTAIDP